MGPCVSRAPSRYELLENESHKIDQGRDGVVCRSAASAAVSTYSFSLPSNSLNPSYRKFKVMIHIQMLAKHPIIS